MWRVALRHEGHHWLKTPGLLGYLLYSGGVIFFIEEFSHLESRGVIRSSQYMVFTFAICILLLTISSILLQTVHGTPSEILVCGFSFAFLVIIEQSFSIFPLTELSCLSGFLIILNSRLHPTIGLSLSLILILMHLSPSVLTSIMGRNILVVDGLLESDPTIQFAGTIVLSVIAIGTSFAQTAFRQKAEAEESVHHLDTTINQLSKINQDLQSYARTIDEEAISRERNRISREIHDISGYRFTNVIALMDAAISMGGRDQEKLQELYLAARNQARDGLLETRRALRALRADELYIKQGIPAIYKICSVFHTVTGIDIAIEAGNIPKTFGPDIDLAIYRLIQEALTNAMRHGRATEVKVYFWIRNGILEVVVRDNGLGAQQVVKGIGLSGMEERLANLGGSLETGSVPEGGFKLKARIPIKKASSV